MVTIIDAFKYIDKAAFFDRINTLNLQGKVRILTGGKARESPLFRRTKQNETKPWDMIWCDPRADGAAESGVRFLRNAQTNLMVWRVLLHNTQTYRMVWCALLRKVQRRED
jgi:hypothetical protein